MEWPIISICRIKRAKHFWGVWDYYDPKRETPPLVGGIATTHEEARRQARAAGGPDVIEISHYASSWYTWNAGHLVAGYSVEELGPGRYFWVSFIWYDRRSGAYGAATSGEAPTLESAYSQAVAATGSEGIDLGVAIGRHFRTNGPYRPKPRERRRHLSVSYFEEQAFSDLGIDVPESVDTVKEAYRAGALKKHPDAGGKAGDFVRLEAAYRVALAFCSRYGMV